MNFVPNELITCDDRDAPQMNRYINNLIVVVNDFRKKMFCRLAIWAIFSCLKIRKPVNSAYSHS